MITDRIIDGSNDTITAQMETGLSNVLVEVRRRSDGFYLDWNDDTFKVSGWTTKNAVMTEVGTTGQYERALLLANVVNLTPDDVYVITVIHSTSQYSPQIGELKAGDWVTPIVNNLDAPISQAALETSMQAVKDKTDRMVFDSRSGPGNILAAVDFTPVLALLGVNRRIKDVVHDSDGNLLSATVCGYETAADAQNDENPILTIAVTGTALAGFQNSLLEVDAS
jgi:hypothetical protein